MFTKYLPKLNKRNLMIFAGVLVALIVSVIIYSRSGSTNQKGGSSEKIKIILFYAPWCPHCKDVMDDWKKVSENHKGDNVTVKKINCEATPEEATKNGVEGFPTIILFRDGKDPVTFSGDRTASSIETFISNPDGN